MDKSELNALIDAVPVPTFLVTPEARISFFNAPAGEILGNEIEDRHYAVALRQPGILEAIEQASVEKKDVQSQFTVTPSGGTRRFRVTASPVELDRSVFVLVCLEETTESHDADQMRRDFVANASHELRSPLTVISGYLEALAEDSELSQKWTRPLAQMQSQSARMNQILVELMELSRLESAASAPRDEVIDVSRLLHQVRESHLQDEGLASIVVDAETDIQLLGSGVEIESLVANLLSNALRFTPASGEIRLSWRLSDAGADLIVKDTGVGIDAIHIPRLTERFYRVDRGRGRDDGGVGLGLAIVKHILARHDGHLEVVSEPGAGSEFCCKFPAERLQ